MNTKYGYFSINQNLPIIWEKSRNYWKVQKKIFINHNTSYTTNKFGKMDLSKKRSFKQSEEYKISFAQDPNNPNLTYVRVYFEYYGDAFLGATRRMEQTINEWINQFNLPSISFHRNALKEYEVFFDEMIEDYQLKLHKSENNLCPYCSKEIEEGQKICQFCGSTID